MQTTEQRVNALKQTYRSLRTQQGRGTVTVVLVMAVLALLVLYSLGYELIIATEGTKAVGLFKQIEQANQEFRLRHHNWPQDLVEGDDPIGNILVITAPDQILTGKYADISPVLENAPVEGGIMRHKFGTGGEVMQTTIMENNQKHILIIMTNVPVGTWRQADRKQDGEVDWKSGRIQTDQDPEGHQTVTMTYLANEI